MRTRFTILVVFLLVLSVVPLGSVSADTFETMTITTTTKLIANHDGNIVIGADNVTLDCDGYTVTGDGTTQGIEMGGVTGVTVRNCDVSGFIDGFGIYESSGNTLENNVSHDNNAGFVFRNSHNNTLMGNVGNGNDFAGFFLTDSSSGNTLTSSSANNHNFGFFLDNASGNTLNGNTAESNPSEGFFVRDSSDNLLFNNTAADNGAGFVLSEGSGNTLEDNTAEDNDFEGFAITDTTGNLFVGNYSASNDHGFGLFNAVGNTLEGNTAQDNLGVGFALNQSFDNTLKDNSASGNWPTEERFSGFFVFDGAGNSLEGNSAVGFVDGFHLNRTFGNTLTDNVASQNNAGFVFRGAFDNQVERNSASENNAGFYIAEQSAEDDEPAYPSYGNTFEHNTANSNTYDGFVIRDASFDNILTLNQASENETGFHLTGGSFNNSISGNSATDSSWVGFMVSEGSFGNTLEANTQVGPSNNGYQLSSASGNVFDSNVSLGAWDTGFALIAAENNILVNNTVDGYEPEDLPAPHVGFSLYFSSNENTLSENTTVGNPEAGYLIVESNNNHLLGNTASFSGNGFHLREGSDANTLVGNTAEHNGAYGFALEDADWNYLEANSASDTRGEWFAAGFKMAGSADRNTLLGNYATGAALAGIMVEFSSDGNILTDNTSEMNDRFGFLVQWGSSGNALDGNLATSNGSDGFGIFQAGEDNDFRGNTANENGRFGFQIWDTQHTTLSGNTANNNTVNGFYLEAASQNALKGNTATGGDHGIYLTESHDNTLADNTSTGPVYHGFSLWYSDGNMLKGNRADTEGDAHGFVLVDSDGNSFKDNDAQGKADACPPPDPEEPCGGSGFHILGSSDNQFVGNSVDNYLIGVGASDGPWVDVFHGSHRNVYKDNGVSRGLLGFNLQGLEDDPTRDNVLVGNVATGFYHGFRLADAVGNTLTDNTATYNSGDGFILSSSAGNTLKDNLARYNQYGFGLGNGSTGNWLVGNTSRQNDLFGFSAFGSSPGNLLKENKACQNGEYDIWSHATSPFELVDNKVCGDSFVGHALVIPGWDADGDATAAGQMIADAIADVTGVDFRAVVVDSPRQMYDLMCALPGTAVGLMGSHYYAVASEDCGVDASFKAIRFGRDHYQSQFVVDEDNTAAGIADLDGLLWAYSSTYSVSGFLVPLGMMEIAGVAASAVLETDDHLAAITAVSLGEADFATTFVSPALPENVRVLVESPPIPNAPIAFGAEFPAELRSAVEAALIEVAATPAGGAAFRVLDRYMEGISPASDAEWDWLRAVLDAAGFGIDDLW